MRPTAALWSVLLLVGSTATADVLVTREGGEIETRGPWKIKGRTVVFTTPGGTLSSVRLDEVDLDKSAVATARQKLPPPPPAEPEAKPEKKAPVLVITDRDVPKASDAAATTSGAGSALRVGNWKLEPLEGDPAFELVGTVTNSGSVGVTAVEINVRLSAADDSGSLTVVGQLDQPALTAGGNARFRIPFSQQRVESSGFAETFAQAKPEFSFKADALPEEPTASEPSTEPEEQ